MPTVTDVAVTEVPTGDNKTGGFQVSYTLGPDTDGVRIGVCTPGTRDNKLGLYVDRVSPYVNVVPYGTYDFHVAPWGGGLIGSDTPVLGVEIAKPKGNSGQGGGNPNKP